MSHSPLPIVLRALPALVMSLLLPAGALAQDYPLAGIGSIEGLPAPNPAAFDEFGGAVATSGTTAAIASPGADGLAGKVDLFERIGSAFVYLASLSEPSLPARAGFGAALALDGDTLAVGAPNPHFPATSPGAVWVYVRNGASFELEQVLEPSAGLLGDQFGRALSLDGDRLAVGVPFDDDQGTQAGAVIVFDRSGSTWTETALLLPDDGAVGDQFGRAVALDGDTVVVGSWLSDVAAVDGGAAYVFVTDDDINWTQQAQLVPATNADGDHVGEAVALIGERAVLAAPFVDQGGGLDDTGVAYAFERDAGAWSETATLQGTGAAVNGHFGCALSSFGTLLLAGSPGAGNNAAGTATLFEFTEGVGYAEAEVLAPAVAADSGFGTAVAVGAAAVLLGAPTADGAEVAGGATVAYSVSLSGLWVDKGKALAGSQGEPVLSGTGTLIGGEPFTISMTNGLPSVPVFLILGFSELCLPFKKGFLVPSPDSIFFAFSTDAGGEMSFGSDWPTGFPGPYSTFFQVWFADPGAPKGFAASNGLEGQVAP